jgi:hypothetical protein
MKRAGLRLAVLLPKQVRTPKPHLWEVRLPRWLIILAVIALVATIAGFLAFGGGNMGH